MYISFSKTILTFDLTYRSRNCLTPELFYLYKCVRWSPSDGVFVPYLSWNFSAPRDLIEFKILCVVFFNGWLIFSSTLFHKNTMSQVYHYAIVFFFHGKCSEKPHSFILLVQPLNAQIPHATCNVVESPVFPLYSLCKKNVPLK